MNFTQRHVELNKRLVFEEMARHGIASHTVANADEFGVQYTVPMVALGHAINAIVLHASPSAPLCLYPMDGTLHLNMQRLERLAGREHRYFLYIMAALHDMNPRMSLSINWASFQVYLARSDSYAEAVNIYWIMLILLHHYRRLGGTDVRAVCDFAEMPAFEPGCFFARPGMVELRAIRTVLRKPDLIADISRRISESYGDEAFMYKNSTSNDADVDDYEWTIRHLITNAGMYGEHAGLEASVREWVHHYLEGMSNAQELYVFWECSIHVLITRILAEQAGHAFDRRPPLMFGDVKGFYRKIAGRRILFVTPFANAVAEVIQRGNLLNLWRNITPEPFSLKPIPAFVSTYPNRPHGSWSETFSRMTAMVDQELATGEYDLVLASCGCYGIPLLNHVHKAHGISAVYNGNLTNMFFGVKQNAFNGYYQDANLEAWADPFHGWQGVPRNIERIDAGRYVAS